jgi:hypothetical protein
LIGLGLKLIEGAINLPVNVSEHLGPCGSICDVGLYVVAWFYHCQMCFDALITHKTDDRCALNVMCASYAGPRIERVNAFRKGGGCEDLHCATFIKAPKSVCADIPCKYYYHHFCCCCCCCCCKTKN